MIMAFRHVIVTTWAVVVGLAGGWLLLSPWAVGSQQTGTDWADSTKSEVAVGVALIGLALIGLWLAISGLMTHFKQRRAAAAATGSVLGTPTPPEVEVDDLLGLLAKALNQEVARQKESGSPATRMEQWREEP
ncbi:MAG: hypothetical protein ACREN8_04535 [Candidatus Dormibacteraceae bacterium]